MNISLSWLKHYIQCDLEEQEIAEYLTHCGLEVEAIEDWEQIQGSLQGVVVGEVLEVTQHPGADRLKLTKVNIGGNQPLSIVCGASNVAVGQKVLVATVGSILYPAAGDKIEIKKSKIRGEVSEGMICAEDELGLGTAHDGIMVLPNDTPAGIDASAYLQLQKDRVFSIGLTPNRIDAASHFGVARDLAAVLSVKGISHQLVRPDFQAPAAGSGFMPYAIEVLSEACHRYSGVLIEGISVNDSPSWLKNKLLSIGVKPINNIVDVTNFVLHETGQPLHAFDGNKIAGNKIVVRQAKPGESLLTLDGVERKLQTTDLVICDEHKPLCMAGIFGGKESGISALTTSVFLESACFDAVSIRKSSRLHALRTDASFRYERGADPEITMKALFRAAKLIVEVAGGKVACGFTDVYPKAIQPVRLALKESYISNLVGQVIPAPVIQEILLSLDFEIISHESSVFTIAVPTYRVDVTRPVDVVEELLRIYGYNRVLEPESIRIPPMNGAMGSDETMEEKTRTFLLSNGFFEAMNLSLTSSVFAEKNVSARLSEPVKLLNPLSSELSMMRQTLLFGLLGNIAYNANRQRPDLSLFEIGRVYGQQDQMFSEDLFLGIAVCGREKNAGWNSSTTQQSFFNLKGVMQSLCNFLGFAGKVNEQEHSGDAFSGLLNLAIEGNSIGTVGELAPKLLRGQGIDFPVYYAEINLSQLKKTERHFTRFKSLPKFPEVKRDLALLINKSISYKAIRDLAFQTEPSFLKDVNLFDVYEGNKLPEGKKSYAVSFILCREDSTLNDKQIEAVMSKLMKAFSEKLGAELRN
jgi:phenylalanyl-tRNA synthetase beta chain